MGDSRAVYTECGADTSAEMDVGWVHIHGLGWVGLGWIVKLQLFVGWLGLGQASSSCANWWREDSDSYCRIAHCILSILDTKRDVVRHAPIMKWQLRSTVRSASVCLSVCPTGYLRNHMRDLYQIFVHVAYVRGSVLLRHASPIAGKGFSSPLTMHYNALAGKGIIRSPVTSCNTRDHSVAAVFAENGIGRDGGDGMEVHSAGEV